MLGWQPRSGGILVAWGVSPRFTSRKGAEPRSGDRHLEDDGCGSRRNHDLSPLQGSRKKPFPVPGADAPGYESVAASRLFTGHNQTGLVSGVNHG